MRPHFTDFVTQQPLVPKGYVRLGDDESKCLLSDSESDDDHPAKDGPPSYEEAQLQLNNSMSDCEVLIPAKRATVTVKECFA